ncbi:MAG: HK97-gp10 family putative phage morphogenesis protein [Pseudomonadota bacterium]
MSMMAAARRNGHRLQRMKTLARDGVRKALATSADEMVGMMKRLAPVDSGTLRDSIGWTWGDAPEGSFAIASATSGEFTITIYAGSKEAWYAFLVEYGTVKTPAQPFFLASYRANRKRASRRVARAVGKAAREAVRGPA